MNVPINATNYVQNNESTHRTRRTEVAPCGQQQTPIDNSETCLSETVKQHALAEGAQGEMPEAATRGFKRRKTDGEETGDGVAKQTRGKTEEKPKLTEAQPVRALVSSLAALNNDMLVKSVLLAGAIATAHLDT